MPGGTCKLVQNCATGECVVMQAESSSLVFADPTSMSLVADLNRIEGPLTEPTLLGPQLKLDSKDLTFDCAIDVSLDLFHTGLTITHSFKVRRAFNDEEPTYRDYNAS